MSLRSSGSFGIQGQTLWPKMSLLWPKMSLFTTHSQIKAGPGCTNPREFPWLPGMNPLGSIPKHNPNFRVRIFQKFLVFDLSELLCVGLSIPAWFRNEQFCTFLALDGSVQRIPKKFPNSDPPMMSAMIFSFFFFLCCFQFSASTFGLHFVKTATSETLPLHLVLIF